MPPKKNIHMITGASGFIGKNLTLKFDMENENMILCSRKAVELTSPNIIHLNSELADVSHSNFNNVDTLIHLASAGVNQDLNEDIKELFKINLVDSYELIIKALESGVKKVIYVSSCFEYGYNSTIRNRELSPYAALMPQNQYAATKAALSTLLYPLCHYYKAEIYNIRAFNLYGPYERSNRLYPSTILSIDNKTKLEITHGQQTKYFSHVDTIVEKIFNIVKQPFKKPTFYIENHGEGNEQTVYEFTSSLFKDAKLDPSLYISRTKPERQNEPPELVPILTENLFYEGRA